MLDRFLMTSEYFKEKRLSAGLTQLEVSDALGFKSPQIVSNWERGQCAPPTQCIGDLIELYSLNAAEVVDIITEENKRYLQTLLKVKVSSAKLG